MQHICLYFQIHQPFRLRQYRFFDIGHNHQYFDESQNASIVKRVAEKCYLPTNDLVLDLIRKTNGKFKVSFSISGTALDQFEMYSPEVIDSFIQLSQTGAVEFLSETSSHSLASVADVREFSQQINEHTARIEKLFGTRPRVLRNTELIYSDNIGATAHDLGFDGIITEGADQVLNRRSPNFLYRHPSDENLVMMLRNYRLSDDIAFRFNSGNANGNRLTVDEFLRSLFDIHHAQPIVNLSMDYETFGEHHWAENGILDFLKKLCFTIVRGARFKFITPSEAVDKISSVSALRVEQPISWADEARDLSAWLGNDLQHDAFTSLYALTDIVRNCRDKAILKDWRYLQTSDHFYYMCTKSSADGEVHKYFNPYDSPYSAYMNYMNILSDFCLRLEHSEENGSVKSEANLPEHAQPLLV